MWVVPFWLDSNLSSLRTAEEARWSGKQVTTAGATLGVENLKLRQMGRICHAGLVMKEPQRYA